jgi:hypothetical protein
MNMLSMTTMMAMALDSSHPHEIALLLLENIISTSGGDTVELDLPLHPQSTS